MSNFNIGDIVATKPHPYFKGIIDVKIAGEPINVIPLMVIIEIYNETRTAFNEETGEEITRKGNGKYKCVWFSLKTNSFSDAWFDLDALKLIDDRKEIVLEKKESDLEFKKRILKEYLNKTVNFKTANLELRKVKETKLHDKTLNRISDYNSLLNFVAPPLQIIDVKLADEKYSGRFDPKTGDSKKVQPFVSFKCRYYNALADKWSELFLPSDTVVEILDVKDHLIKIDEDRKAKKFYVYDYAQEENYHEKDKESRTILEIDDLTYINGSYGLKVYDWIHQEWKILELPLEGIIDHKVKNDIYLKDSYPNFAFEKGSKSPDVDNLLTEFTEFINEQEKKRKYLLITYVNKSEKVIRRVIRDYFIVPGATKKASTYLHGFCCKKREERSFNFSNIRSVRVISL